MNLLATETELEGLLHDRSMHRSTDVTQNYRKVSISTWAPTTTRTRAADSGAT